MIALSSWGRFTSRFLESSTSLLASSRLVMMDDFASSWFVVVNLYVNLSVAFSMHLSVTFSVNLSVTFSVNLSVYLDLEASLSSLKSQASLSSLESQASLSASVSSATSVSSTLSLTPIILSKTSTRLRG